MVTVEAATLAGAAVLLAVPVGTLLSRMTVSSCGQSLAFTVGYHYPWAWLPGLAVVGVLLAEAGARAPAPRVSRLHVVEALRFE